MALGMIDTDRKTGDLYHELIALQKLEDFDSMVSLVEKSLDKENSLGETKTGVKTPLILYLYAFGLSRRNRTGDRDKCLEVIKQALSLALELENQNQSHPGTGNENNKVLELFCLQGRIYKNKFVESEFQDLESLNSAIEWYRKAFQVRSSEFAGINLATLLVAKGEDFQGSSEFKNMEKVLNDILEKKGLLKRVDKSSNYNYWDLATLLEFDVIRQNYGRAVETAAAIFKLDPAPTSWHVKSTLGNIEIVQKLRERQKLEKRGETPQSLEKKLFQNWTEFLQASVNKNWLEQEEKLPKIPVLIEEQTDAFTVKYVNFGADNRSLEISQTGHGDNDSDLDLDRTLVSSDLIRLSEDDCRTILIPHREDAGGCLRLHFPNAGYRDHAQKIVNLK